SRACVLMVRPVSQMALRSRSANAVPVWFDRNARRFARRRSLRARGSFVPRKAITGTERGGLFDPMLGEVVAERSLADAERLGGFFLDAVRPGERLLHDLPLGAFEVRPKVQALRRRVSLRRRAEAGIDRR